LQRSPRAGSLSIEAITKFRFFDAGTVSYGGRSQ
jgi:hypothetical protein